MSTNHAHVLLVYIFRQINTFISEALGTASKFTSLGQRCCQSLRVQRPNSWRRVSVPDKWRIGREVTGGMHNNTYLCTHCGGRCSMRLPALLPVSMYPRRWSMLDGIACRVRFVNVPDLSPTTAGLFPGCVRAESNPGGCLIYILTGTSRSPCSNNSALDRMMRDSAIEPP